MKFDLQLRPGANSRSRKNIGIYAAVLEPLGMAVLDAFPVMKANPKVDAFTGAWHPNELGHVFMAQMVAHWFDFGFTAQFRPVCGDVEGGQRVVSSIVLQPLFRVANAIRAVPKGRPECVSLGSVLSPRALTLIGPPWSLGQGSNATS